MAETGVTTSGTGPVGLRDGVLYLAPEWPWPPRSGGRAHAAGLASMISASHDVTVVAPDMPSAASAWSLATEDARARRGRRTNRGVDIVRSFALRRHVVLERAIQSRMPEAFAQLVSDLAPSVVVLGRPYFGPFIEAARNGGAAVVLDADESSLRVARSIARSAASIAVRVRAAIESRALVGFERTSYQAADQIWVTSEIESAWVHRLERRASVAVVPNVAPREVMHVVEARPIEAVAFVGWYRYPPNEAAALELIEDVMPLVRRGGGPSRLVLIGRDPSHRVMAAAARDADTVVTGEVEDIAPVLRGAGVLASPVRSGGGTRVKVLEAAALGVPVVSTTFGIEGLAMRNGHEVLVADDPVSMAASLIRLASDPLLRTDIARRASELVGERWSVAAIEPVVRDALARLNGGDRQRRGGAGASSGTIAD